ncbi:plasma membrane ATPase 2-like isoform X1 [Citrus clementina]|uniref:plasma membrane ATPase 2-like isoform X1 n=1 Tax=Citrus clementina TaxID=85681 RepID=UPI000CED289F|nr:plasma membrane ATPase 2-like isoform X1 [Citrus x clementina]
MYIVTVCIPFHPGVYTCLLIFTRYIDCRVLLLLQYQKIRVRPSPHPERWNLTEIFVTGSILGGYLAMMTVIFFWTAYGTDFFPSTFGVSSLNEKNVDDGRNLASAVYLLVSSISQGHLFVTRARSWSYVECPVLFLALAFCVAQLTATLIAVNATWSFATIEGIGWSCAGVIWLYNIIFYILLDFIKFFIRYVLSRNFWDLVTEQRIAFTTKRDFGKEERERRWAQEQRTLHGLHPRDTSMFSVQSSYELSRMAEEARRRAEIARLRELHTLKGRVESLIRLKGLDIDPILQSYSV